MWDEKDLSLILGMAIKFCRKRLDLSQGELSKLMEYKSASGVCKLESGTTEPNFTALYKLALVLEVDVSTLVKFAEEFKEIPYNLSEKIINAAVLFNDKSPKEIYQLRYNGV